MPQKKNKVLFKNRYLGWFLALAAIAGIGLVFYILISSQNQGSEFIFPSLKKEKTFIDYKDKFYQRYPADWQLEQDNSGAIVFENPQNPSESVSIEPASYRAEQEVRASLKISNETDFARGGNSYATFIGTAPKSGLKENIAFIKTSQGRYFYVSGNSKDFNSFVLNFNAF